MKHYWEKMRLADVKKIICHFDMKADTYFQNINRYINHN